jgi:hypothetical protein
MRSGLFITPSSVTVILRFAQQSLKPSTQARPAIPVTLNNGFGILFFSQYVNVHVISIFEVMGHSV